MIVSPLLTLFILEVGLFLAKYMEVSMFYPVLVTLFLSLYFLGFPLVFCASPLGLLITVLLSLSAPSRPHQPSLCFEKALQQKLSLLLNARLSSAVISPGFQHLVNRLLKISEHVM